MKAIEIHFYSAEENVLPRQPKAPKAKKVLPAGFISAAGKLTFPAKTVAELGSDLAGTFFKVGVQEGERKAKSLYLVPTNDEQAGAFQLQQVGNRYVLALPIILQKSGIDVLKNKYAFTIDSFVYEGTAGFELQLSATPLEPKAPYTGKPRGRKRRTEETAE
jgi:hypothetical protein